MTGKPELLMPSTKHMGHMTLLLDLRVFAYENFLEFIVWTVREQDASRPTWSYYGNWIEMKNRSKVFLILF
ncbi:hypothetical protein H310_15407 [Aphanomyces invadans]|uniref:Uncharacterized protein n=1 Tax=Aphanomyces invadans TaxID=157072 RepID=A0A024T7H9_9STRA|nr:hypothetical protein H310_15407 [Aphanomyces invadans]ETV89764.1 hypothetical protein H310_15407 [Aphanomyces invadans]|eukprot:XP_008881604.1 hypothetical protein H310_15407 [Aphanomyces invadans]